MEASLAPAVVIKPHQSELLDMHPMQPLKHYESEEEDVSETSSQCAYSPTAGELGSQDESDTDESVEEVESNSTGMLAPPHKTVSSDASTSFYSQRLSLITGENSNTTTCIPNKEDQDQDTKDEIVHSPFYLSPVCYSPDDENSSRKESVHEDNDEDDVHEVFEAKQIIFTMPASRPNIVVIHSPTIDTVLSSQEQSSVERSPIDTNRSSSKRSSSASGMSTPVDRSKRYSAMFFRDFNQDGEIAYLDSPSPKRSTSRSRRVESPMRSNAVRGGNNRSNAETSRPRRNTSQRSGRSSRYMPDHEAPRNYSRPRRSSIASDITSASSVSNASLQYSSSSSVEQPSQQGEDDILTPKPTPHPLSVFTTPASPPTSSLDSAAYATQTRSAISPCTKVDWSPAEYTNTSTAKSENFPYSLPLNPSLSLSHTTTAEDYEPRAIYSRSRTDSGSTTSSSFAGSTTTTISAKQPVSSTGTMKFLMNGFRGRGIQRR